MKTIINGHTVEYEEDAKHGIYYLIHQIDADEKKVFFQYAFSHGFAKFEDQMGRNYKLIHHGSEYILEKA
jgi:hypothetical protein